MELAGVLAGLVFLAVLAWLGDLRWHPYARCWACKGKSRNRGSTPRRYGLCGRCKGSGRRVRVGAKLVRPELRKGK